jgi:hypothetical protein
MKTSNISIVFAAAISLSGCVSHKNGLVLDPVGPPIAHLVVAGASGWLVVFSALDVNAPYPAGDDYRQRYTDYEIYSADGKPLKTVRNDTWGSFDEPTKVELPAGAYRIVARANRYGRVTVPVVIVPGNVTEVHLEGGAPWPDNTAFTSDNAVRLPDGRVVGWRAVN